MESMIVTLSYFRRNLCNGLESLLYKVWHFYDSNLTSLSEKIPPILAAEQDLES